jgi:hypothetical protein
VVVSLCGEVKIANCYSKWINIAASSLFLTAVSNQHKQWPSGLYRFHLAHHSLPCRQHTSIEKYLCCYTTILTFCIALREADHTNKRTCWPPGSSDIRVGFSVGPLNG